MMHLRLSLYLLIISACFAGCNTASEQNTSALLHTITDSLHYNRLPADQQIRLVLKADSLAGTGAHDSLHLSLQKKVAEFYFNAGDLKNAKKYFLQAAEIARKSRDLTNMAICLNNTGLIFDELYETDSAIKYYTEANRIFYFNKDSLHFAEGLINIGTLYKNKGEYSKAVTASITAVNILEAIKNKRDLCDAYGAVGNCMKALKQFDKALEYHQKALSASLAEHDSSGASGALNNIGNIYRYKKDYAHALESYQAALVIKQKTNKKKSIATTLDNIAETYLEQGDHLNAKAYFIKALDMRRSAGDKDGISTSANRLSRLMLEMNDIAAAEAFAGEASITSSEVNYLKQQLDNALLLTDIYKRSGRHQAALDYAALSMKLKDSLFNTGMAQAISEAETKYKTKETEQKLVFVNQLKEQQSRQIGTQKRYITSLTILVILLLIVSYLVLRLSKQQRQARKKVEVLMSELNHRVKNNLQVITSILQLQIYSVDDPGQKALLDSSKNRVHSIWAIHELLQKQSYTGMIRMGAFINALIININKTFGERADLFTTTMTGDDVSLKTDIAIPVGLIINEWLTNLFKHGLLKEENGIVTIELTHHHQKNQLRISDNCRPWEHDTKGSKGLGLYLVEELTIQLNGSYKITHDAAGNMLTIIF